MEKVKLGLEEIWLNDVVTDKSVLDLRKRIIEQADMFPNAPIIIYLNTPGGSIDSLTILVDTLEDLKKTHEVITVCVGKAMSAGAVIFACGSQRFVAPSSVIMLHQASTLTRGTATDLTKVTEDLDKATKYMTDVITRNCKVSKSLLNKIFQANTDFFLEAKEAVKFGIATEMGLPRLERHVEYKVIVT